MLVMHLGPLERAAESISFEFFLAGNGTNFEYLSLFLLVNENRVGFSDDDDDDDSAIDADEL